MLEAVQRWLQSYLDKAYTGSVNLHICDGKPGNCTVYLVSTKEIARSRSLQAQLQVTYRSCYKLMYLENYLDDGWMEGLNEFLKQEISQEAVFLEFTGYRFRPEGTVEHTGILTVEYTRDYGEDDL